MVSALSRRLSSMSSVVGSQCEHVGVRTRHAMLMHQLLLNNAGRQPDKLAFQWVDRSKGVTNAQAVDLMERMAGGLHDLGVRKGDRVTVFAHNGLDYLITMFAAWRLGAIVALVNIKFADELDYYVADHAPKVVVYTHD